jgi:hypothetical protein
MHILASGFYGGIGGIVGTVGIPCRTELRFGAGGGQKPTRFFFLVEKRKKKEKGLCYGVFRLISVNVTEGISI